MKGCGFMAPSDKKEQTRYKLAQAIKECMQTTPVDHITVRQIVEKCHLSRQTFYRNFLDKYDLINWYFDKLLHESFEHMGSGKTVTEGLVKKFRYIQQERVFFMAAFRSDDCNSLKEHDFALIFQFYTDLIEKKTGASLSQELKFILEMYCYSSIYMTVKWVLTGMKTPPEQLAPFMVEAMPAKLEQLFIRLKLL